MTSKYWNSTRSRFASAAALVFGRTLNPMTGAPLAAAVITSLSVMPPTPDDSTRTLMSAVEMRLTAPTIASTDPCVSALTTIGYSIALGALKLANTFSMSTGAETVRRSVARLAR